jgi:hypothetical protein
VCKHGNQWRSPRSFLGTGCKEVFDTERWAIGLTLDVSNEKGKTLQKHEVKKVTVFSDSQAAMRRTADLEPGPGQRLARLINRMAGGSAPTPSHPESTASRYTPASLEMNKQTSR